MGTSNIKEKIYDIDFIFVSVFNLPIQVKTKY